MLFNYSYQLTSMVIFCLSIYILLTFFMYSTQGDMDNVIKDIKKLKKIEDKDEIIDKLFGIIIESKTSVSWPITLCISILVSSLITYCTSTIDDLDRKFLITTMFLFFTIFSMFSFVSTHGGQKQIINSIILHNNKN